MLVLLILNEATVVSREQVFTSVLRVWITASDGVSLPFTVNSPNPDLAPYFFNAGIHEPYRLAPSALPLTSAERCKRESRAP